METAGYVFRMIGGFILQLVTFQFGIRPVLSLLLQIGLQTAIVLSAFQLPVLGAVAVISLLMLFHLSAAFRVSLVAFSISMDRDRKGKYPKTPEEKAKAA